MEGPDPDELQKRVVPVGFLHGGSFCDDGVHVCVAGISSDFSDGR